jgi:pullulanase
MKGIAMGQQISALAVADQTPADEAKPCPDYPTYRGDDLGATPDGGAALHASGTTFRVWSPAASAVTVRVFAAGSPAQAPEPQSLHELAAGPDGTWLAHCEGVGHGAYYDYLVHFRDGSCRRTADPWARAAGVNGRRSMVVDLARTDPADWAQDARPRIPDNKLVIWETHIGDFSNDEHSGVPAAHRGTYLAFTDTDTSVDGKGEFPTCLAYVKRLGVTAVQLMPFYDYATVDESLPRSDPSRAYNWGYDPLNYNVPEGSYSTDPFDGAVRIKECKQMIQALHAAGTKVIMDVVYNHMFAADNWLERMMPGYALRRRADGGLANGSACSNDVASEHPMIRKYIVDSVVYWAREYHIDGFRFDLMGLIDVGTMNAIRHALDALPNGASILMYGEPWSARRTALEPGTILANKRGMPYLDTRIGMFCDSTRDAVRGHVFYQHVPGYVSGAAQDYASDIRYAVDGWRGSRREPASVGQLLQYVSAHDDLTLWDKLCAALRPMPSGRDYRAETGAPADDEDIAADATQHARAGLQEAAGAGRAGDAGPGAHPDTGGKAGCGDIMRAACLAAGIVFSSAGVPFLLSGEEFARTKHGMADSYNSPAALNQLDWRRAQRFSALVDCYAALIRMRKENALYFGGARVAVPRTDACVVFLVGDDCIAINPTPDTRVQSTFAVEAPGPCDATRRDAPVVWTRSLCFHGEDGCGKVHEAGRETSRAADRGIVMPPYSFAVWHRERARD